jgi:hypothetical protein
MEKSPQHQRRVVATRSLECESLRYLARLRMAGLAQAERSPAIRRGSGKAARIQDGRIGQGQKRESQTWAGCTPDCPGKSRGMRRPRWLPVRCLHPRLTYSKVDP